MSTALRVGDLVQWKDSALNLRTRRRHSYTDRGRIYRIDKDRIAVLPESWAKEGKIHGLMIEPQRLTKTP